MTGIPNLGIRADIMGQVLDPLLCVFLAGIQSVGIGVCMHVCVTEPTCIPYWASRTDIVGQVLGPSMCLQMAGPLPLPGALNHWGRYLPQGPTICILCACGGATPVAGRP